jgi:ribosomal protein S6
VAGALDSGYYVNFVFNADPTLVAKLRAKFKLDPEVYRQSYERLAQKKEKPAKRVAKRK